MLTSLIIRSLIEFLEKKLLTPKNISFVLKHLKLDLEDLWDTLYYSGTPYKIECFISNIEEYLMRVFDYIKRGFNDHDWDMYFVLLALQYKLERLEKALLEDEYRKDSKKRAKQIRLVLIHIDRYINSHTYYYNTPEIGEHENIFDYLKEPLSEERIKDIKFGMSQEQKHWKAIWRIISRYGQAWYS